jgi:hypothetical protein
MGIVNKDDKDVTVAGDVVGRTVTGSATAAAVAAAAAKAAGKGVVNGGTGKVTVGGTVESNTK